MNARRRSGLEDLMDFASKLHWALSLILFVVVFVALTLISQHYLAPTSPTQESNIAAPLVNSMYGYFAGFARWLIAPPFLVGAGVSWWKSRHRVRLLSDAKADPAEIERLSWRDFERLVGQAYRQQGYFVTELGGQGPDGGVDLILKRDGLETLVQCKQWREQRVGVSTIRELHGVMAHRRALAGIVVTLGGFTADAQTFARGCNIRLLDRGELTALLRSVDAQGSDPHQDQPFGSSATAIPACPRCGSTMIRRVARQGRNKGRAFLGCSRYPQCRETKSVDA